MKKILFFLFFICALTFSFNNKLNAQKLIDSIKNLNFQINQLNDQIKAYRDILKNNESQLFFANDSLSTENTLIKTKKIWDQYIRSNYLTEPTTVQDAEDYKNHFDDENVILGKYVYPSSSPAKRLCYSAVWVDLGLLRSIFANPNLDGFRIYPIRYTKDNIVDGDHFAKEDISFMIVLTIPGSTPGTHKDIPQFSYDYNHPCPTPPCPNQ